MGGLLGRSLAPPRAAARTWTDHTGANTIEADLIVANDTSVVLGCDDGRVLTLPIDRLSKDDQAYVAEQRTKIAADKAPASSFRLWLSTGGHRFYGEAVEILAENVTLRPRKGASIAVPISQMSDKDREFLETRKRPPGPQSKTGAGPAKLTAAKDLNVGGSYLTFSPNGEWLAASDSQTGIVLYAASDGSVQWQVNDRSRHTRCLAFSPDSTKLASATEAPAGPCIWSVSSGQRLAGFENAKIGELVAKWPHDMKFAPQGLVFAPDGETFLAGSKSVYLVPITGLAGVIPTEMYAGSGKYQSVWAMTLSADGTMLAQAVDDNPLINVTRQGAAHLYIVSGQAMRGVALKPRGIRRVNAVAFSPDGKTLAVAGESRAAAQAGGARPQPAQGVPAAGAKKQPAAPIGDYGSLTLWRPPVGGLKHTPGGKTITDLLISCSDYSVGAMVTTHDHLPGGRRTTSVAVDSDERPVVQLQEWFTKSQFGQDVLLSRSIAIYEGRKWRTFYAFSNQPIAQMPRATLEFGTPIVSVAFSPDGTLMAFGGGDGVVRVAESASGRVLAELHGHGGSVRSVAFSPSGDTLASISSDATKLWMTNAWPTTTVLRR